PVPISQVDGVAAGDGRRRGEDPIARILVQAVGETAGHRVDIAGGVIEAVVVRSGLRAVAPGLRGQSICGLCGCRCAAGVALTDCSALAPVASWFTRALAPMNAVVFESNASTDTLPAMPAKNPPPTATAAMNASSLEAACTARPWNSGTVANWPVVGPIVPS